MRSLVTGGAGFIGSTLVDALISRGDEVAVVDNLTTGSLQNLATALAADVTFYEEDISVEGTLNHVLAETRPEVIFHLAAQADVRRSIEQPASDAEANILGTINVLEGARRHGARVVFTSSGGAGYGEGAGRALPFSEAAIPCPEAPYGVSKIAGEAYVDMYRRLHKIPGIALRLGNVFGPRQDPNGEAGVVAIFCGRLLEGKSVRVYGDGLQTRDYIFVSDVVNALLSADAKLQEVGPELSGILNIGTGIETSILDLITTLGTLASKAFVPDFAPARQGEIRRVSLDPTLASALIEWTPAVEIEEGLRVTLKSVDLE